MKTVYFEDDVVVVLDQRKLPGEVVYEKLDTVEKVAEAIKLLMVRGAPLIGVTAAFGLAMAVSQFKGSREELKSYFKQAKDLLASTRPTAVNLFWALNRMEQVFNQYAGEDVEIIKKKLKQTALKMYEEDIKVNEAIGEYGSELLPVSARVMTICNAGAAATCGFGTALGVVRAGFNKGRVDKVWACETRPVLQGARLTVWELIQDNIPVTLITDNMAGYVMNLGNVDVVVVGADRIAANGDTANKIGTYSLAVLAYHHNIPFYVAAPLSTIDLNIGSGGDIPIEERDKDEVRKIKDFYITVEDVDVFNPAFDVTPNHLIKGIITEKGVITPPFSEGIKMLKGK
ncbi:S-methyl-5-thioribose-1-phosphate isomerase [Thermosyntropha sp.]|uniref:S-methyl-5-thioribose-1-phosphate isomerase n=1 Tax=Thermosyntropha sp. TaxID=2740820 RepID=UPI0025CEA724|nr:S-methyl-5-thioribose-1-phosphate isomerase [Thermosyntropha sp.]